MRFVEGKSLFVVGVVAAVIAAVVGGLLFIGSPGQERLRRLDGRRVADLAGVAEATDLYWTRKMTLPISLEELAHTPGLHLDWRDPVTGQPYAYQALDDSTYELCAVFTRSSIADGSVGKSGFWAHGAGRQCFRLIAKRIEPG
jgi:hypothetical protein